jgi:hypothetical protein
MSKKIQLSIAEPCHENWENMNPVEKGKFCGSCQKQVVDFSNMSDRQVAEFFKKPSTGSVCGRFMSDQLDREIEIPRKRIPWIKYFFTIALPAFFISKASSQNITMGRIAKPAVKDTSRIPVKKELRTLGMVAPNIQTEPVCRDTTETLIKGDIAIVETKPLNGKVVDENGNPVSSATVMIKGTRTSTTVNEDGTFSILPSANWQKIILLVSCIGFEGKEVMINSSNYKNNKVINIGLVPVSYELMGEVVVVGRVAVCTPDKKTDPIIPIPEIIKDAGTKSFKVYPNPVISGTNLTIEWKQAEEGYYTLQLLNQSGQAAHRQEIWIDAEPRFLNIDVPFVSAGSYFLMLTNKKTGKKFSEKIIVQ